MISLPVHVEAILKTHQERRNYEDARVDDAADGDVAGSGVAAGPKERLALRHLVAVEASSSDTVGMSCISTEPFQAEQQYSKFKVRRRSILSRNHLY